MRLSIFLLFLLAITAYQCQLKPNTPPNIHFDHDTLNFGTIKANDSVTIAFNFQNIGGDSLKILNVEPSCRCSVVNFSKKGYNKGAKGTIYVRYSNFEDQEFGEINKIILVRSNSQPSLHVLTLMGKINYTINLKATL